MTHRDGLPRFSAAGASTRRDRYTKSENPGTLCHVGETPPGPGAGAGAF